MTKLKYQKSAKGKNQDLDPIARRNETIRAIIPRTGWPSQKRISDSVMTGAKNIPKKTNTIPNVLIMSEFNAMLLK